MITWLEELWKSGTIPRNEKWRPNNNRKAIGAKIDVFINGEELIGTLTHMTPEVIEIECRKCINNGTIHVRLAFTEEWFEFIVIRHELTTSGYHIYLKPIGE